MCVFRRVAESLCVCVRARTCFAWSPGLCVPVRLCARVHVRVFRSVAESLCVCVCATKRRKGSAPKHFARDPAPPSGIRNPFRDPPCVAAVGAVATCHHPLCKVRWLHVNRAPRQPPEQQRPWPWPDLLRRLSLPAVFALLVCQVPRCAGASAFVAVGAVGAAGRYRMLTAC